MEKKKEPISTKCKYSGSEKTKVKKRKPINILFTVSNNNTKLIGIYKTYYRKYRYQKKTKLKYFYSILI